MLGCDVREPLDRASPPQPVKISSRPRHRAKEPSRPSSSVSRWRMTRRVAHPGHVRPGAQMPDVVFVGLIVLFFAALVLLVKALERL